MQYQNGHDTCAGGAHAVCGSPLCRRVRRKTEPRSRHLLRNQRLNANQGLKLWTVINGLVASCSNLPDGRRQIISLSLPGDVVCPAVGAGAGEAWVEALTESDVCELDFTPYLHAFEEDAQVSAELFRMAHKHVRESTTHLIALGRMDGMERVCFFLADMAGRAGQRTSQGWRVNLPLSREDIADYMGLNAETVSRILGRVKKAGLAVFLSPTEYLVPNIKALQGRVPIPVAITRREGDDTPTRQTSKVV